MRSLFRTAAFLAALAVICACYGGKEDSASLSVNPGTISAECAGGSYAVNVHTASDWTVTVLDEAGNKIGWAVPSRVIGHGDGEVKVTVQKNSLSISRTARMTIKAMDGPSAVVTINQAGDASSSMSGSSVDLRIGSYNLRISTADDGDNVWSLRQPRVLQSIRDNRFDVFGVQECDNRIQSDLKSQLQDEYVCWFFSPYNQTGVGNKAHGILVRKDVFTISDQHFFWMGPDPDKMSTSDVGSMGDFNRGGCCAVVTHKATGIRFFFMCTHACLNDAPNAQYAHIYKDMEVRYNTAGLPSILVGDMNAVPSDPLSAELRTHWNDVYLNLSADKITGPLGTFNGFDLTKDLDKGKRIDFIYYRGGVTPHNYVNNTQRYGGFYASDHMPVYSDMTIESIAK